MVMSFIIATMATTMLTIYPICSNLTSFKLSYALRIHETELIKLIHHYRKLQRLWILDCTGNKGVGVVVSTSIDFLDAIWPFQIFIIKIMIVNLTLIISIWPMVHCIQNTKKIKVGNVKVNGKALKSK
ncbi:unnamed protein product, partial [Vitis vinifera]|uniref:Uncharacterized protein n=1 Tax=Vitis vinifera TaxID=29760 RepID=D7TG32_VITVI